MIDEETRRAAAASVKLTTESFTAEKMAGMAEQRKQTRLTEGKVLTSEKVVHGATQSKIQFNNHLSITTGSSDSGECGSYIGSFTVF